MTTSPAPVAAPETVAASLFVGAFNSVYEDDPRMTITLHRSNGSSLAVAGVLDDYLMRFNPAEVSTLLAWLTHSVATDPDAVISVAAAYRPLGDRAHGWAWRINTGDALGREEADTLFGDEVELLGATQPWVTLRGPRPLVDTSADGLAYTALTDDVKAVVTAHGEPERPAAGHRFALRLDGTVTVHVDAADETAARDALQVIEYEDFDVDVRTRGGHVIGHVTLGEADGADLVSVDDVPADEIG
ncbi:hypothetical protein ABZ023_30955 [Streptomyces sp. NPDC006367]|uniref:hypothetical protein n=1 Tax=unclassified Streptomyces TaxID=2593676 RepID=UPI0033A41FA8